MTTKIFLHEVLPVDIFGEVINQINFEKLDKFVEMLVSGYVYRRGKEIVKKEIDEDSTSDTSNFLTHIIEVGSLKIMQDSDLLGSNKYNHENAVLAIALALNISMATALKAKDVYTLDSVIYYALPAMQSIIPRIVNHSNNALNDSFYTKSLSE